MNTNSPGLLVNAPGLILTVFLIVALSRLFSLLVPTDFYFTFESLFSDRTPRMIMLSLVGKMAAPLFVGVGFGILAYRRSVRGPNSQLRFARMRRRLKRSWSPSMFLAGFISALLSAWPMIIYWDIMANPEIGPYKPIFFLLYAIYMVAFGYVALLGMLGAIFVLEHLNATGDDEKAVSTMELSRVGALWLINSGIASAAMELLTK